MPEEQKEFTIEDLAEYNGQDGRPAYVAHDGRVFDVSQSKRWKNGGHMNRHHAGNDLSRYIQAAPHQADVLDRFPQVGVLKKAEKKGAGDVRDELPQWAADLLDRYPMLWRHPHPMLVHFPLVSMILSPVFTVLYLISGYRPFETTAFHLLGVGLAFTVLAMATGFLTWKLNYLARPVFYVVIKVILSAFLLAMVAAAFFWRLIDPHVLASLNGTGGFYFALVLLLLPMVSVVGWAGAELTFPTPKGGRGGR